MTAAVAVDLPLDTSPLSALRGLRGTITDARLGYPEVLHVQIRDADGGLWWLITQDAEWSPTDPASLVGRVVEDVTINERTGALRCDLSDGRRLEITPAALMPEDDDDPPSWEILTPGGQTLEFGPGARWLVTPSDLPR